MDRFQFVGRADAGADAPVLPGLEVGELLLPLGRYHQNVAATMSSGTLRLAYFTARTSEVAASLTVIVGTGAGATPSLVRLGIWIVGDNGKDLDELVAATANNTALLSTPASKATQALVAPWSRVAGERYAAGLLVVTAAAAPTVAAAASLSSLISTDAPAVSGAVTGQADLPASSTAVVGSTSAPAVIALPA